MNIPLPVFLLVLLVGGTMGLLGSGGAILLLPILVYAGSVPAHAAVPLSLAVVGVTAAFGAWTHYRAGRFSLRVAAIFSSTGAVGAMAGSNLTHTVSEQVLMSTLGVLMLMAAGSMWRPSIDDAETGSRTLGAAASGLVIGIVAGFIGVGGGFMLLPAMIWFAGIRIRPAIGASLTVVAVNAASGLVGHLWAGARPGPEIVPLLVASLVGIRMGAAASRRLNTLALQKAFAIVLALLGLGILAVNAGVT